MNEGFLEEVSQRQSTELANKFVWGFLQGVMENLYELVGQPNILGTRDTSCNLSGPLSPKL